MMKSILAESKGQIVAFLIILPPSANLLNFMSLASSQIISTFIFSSTTSEILLRVSMLFRLFSTASLNKEITSGSSAFFKKLWTYSYFWGLFLYLYGFRITGGGIKGSLCYFPYNRWKTKPEEILIIFFSIQVLYWKS